MYAFLEKAFLILSKDANSTYLGIEKTDEENSLLLATIKSQLACNTAVTKTYASVH